MGEMKSNFWGVKTGEFLWLTVFNGSALVLVER
jgi:hypothetical protein